jgi:ferredoxin
MPLDVKKLEKAIGRDIGKLHTSLCRAQLDSFEESIASGEELIVACTQEAPLFDEIAEESSSTARLKYVNIREQAGWSTEAPQAYPKIAALLGDAEYEYTPARLKSIHSDGMCLVYGSGQEAYEVAKLLSDKLSVTLMLSDTDNEPVLPTVADIPVYRGVITSASGSFGAFEVTVDQYAPMRPSSRSAPEFGIPRNSAQSSCSLILDISEKTPLFSGHNHRDGYASLDPGDPVLILKTAMQFAEMVGEFEKPVYVDYNADTCAHGHSMKTGCSKCLDACPAGAITSLGETVNIDAGICGGCGSCHAVCPTGSISYQYPTQADLISRVHNMLEIYSSAGGKNANLLLHAEGFGTELIGAIARYGDGLPANTIPAGFHSATVFGHVELLSMIAGGASGINILVDPKLADEIQACEGEIYLANQIIDELGLSAEPRIRLLTETDPDKLHEQLLNQPKQPAITNSAFKPVGKKRENSRIVFSKLHAASKAKPDIIPLPETAPYGRVDIDREACTLCMACTSACPASAITDTPGEPRLRFTEAACVQCGLCVTTCPENALALVPQMNFTPAAMQPETLYEEEPFSCISCGKPFATRSVIERISIQLAGKHSMFSSEEQSSLIKMCEDCRIEAQANSTTDPFATSARPRPRTSDDYLNAERNGLSENDFLIDD